MSNPFQDIRKCSSINHLRQIEKEKVCRKKHSKIHRGDG